jgi:FMN-dependent NADH-azoreductase
LKTVFGFIGMTDIQTINANGLNTGLRDQELAADRASIQALSTTW